MSESSPMTDAPAAPLKVVIFDVSDTVLRGLRAPVPGIAAAVRVLRGAGLRVAMVANERTAQVAAALQAASIEVDLVLGRDVVGASKPSPRFCQLVGAKFGASPREMLYVGDNDQTDALCAINAGVLYIAARWANPTPRYGLPADDPNAVLRLIFRFFMAPPRWYWTVERKDRLGRRVHVRGLLPASRQSSDLKEVLKFDHDLRIEGLDYWGFLSRRLMTALSLDGLVEGVDTWTWYPSSTGAPTKRRYATFFDLATRIHRDAYVPDLLVRHTASTKLATARAQGTRPTFQNQIRTVHLNPAYRTKVVGKHVLVADDFCTEGLSFECARNLLFAAGARDVTCVAVGRYWDEYHVHTPRRGVLLDPWAPSALSDADFEKQIIRGQIDSGALTEMKRLLRLRPPGTTGAAPTPSVVGRGGPGRS